MGKESARRRFLFALMVVGLLCIALLGLGRVARAGQRDIGGQMALVSPAGPTLLGLQGIIPPTSNFVLYHREDDNGIWLKNEAGDTRLMNGAHPRLSADGRYVVYQQSIWFGDFYVRDLQTGLDTLVFDVWDTSVGASWTADGSHIVLDHECTIYSVESDGSNPQPIIDSWPSAFSGCYNDNPDSNPVDGRVAWENGQYGLGLAQADGQNPHWIPNTQKEDYSPRWSPDGQWIAFWREDNLFKIRPDGSGLIQLTFLTAEGDWMENSGPWTPDGQYLVAAAKVNGVKGLYAIPSDGSGMLSLLAAREWDDPDWVGSVGCLELAGPRFKVFLPLVRR
jgi:Tol biopolymer transport system component